MVNSVRLITGMVTRLVTDKELLTLMAAISPETEEASFSPSLPVLLTRKIVPDQDQANSFLEGTKATHLKISIERSSERLERTTMKLNSEAAQ